MENGNRDGSSSFFIFEGEYRVGFGISVSDECFFFSLRRIYEISGR